MRLVSTLVLLLAAAPAGAQALDPLPVTFVPGGASVDGCYAQWSTRAAVRAFAAPTEVSTPIRTIDAERRVDANDYSESLTAVLRTGRARARGPVDLDAVRVSTGASERVRLVRGDEVDLLGAADNGAFYVGVGPAVYTVRLRGAFVADGPLEVVQEPVTELWVRLIEHGEGRPTSWLNTAQAGLARREPFCP